MDSKAWYFVQPLPLPPFFLLWTWAWCTELGRVILGARGDQTQPKRQEYHRVSNHDIIKLLNQCQQPANTIIDAKREKCFWAQATCKLSFVFPATVCHLSSIQPPTSSWAESWHRSDSLPPPLSEVLRWYGFQLRFGGWGGGTDRPTVIPFPLPVLRNQWGTGWGKGWNLFGASEERLLGQISKKSPSLSFWRVLLCPGLITLNYCWHLAAWGWCQHKRLWGEDTKITRIFVDIFVPLN